MWKVSYLLPAAVLTCAAALAADSPTIGVEVGGVEVARTPQAAQDPSGRPSRTDCVNHCNAAETKCGSEVRRSRQECSRRAATGGRDPMTQRAPRDPMTGQTNEYAYFCEYFSNTGRCGSDYYSHSCQARFQQHYGVCLDVMQDNMMGARHDCQRAERDAQKFCRDELSACKAECDRQ